MGRASTVETPPHNQWFRLDIYTDGVRVDVAEFSSTGGSTNAHGWEYRVPRTWESFTDREREQARVLLAGLLMLFGEASCVRGNS